MLTSLRTPRQSFLFVAAATLIVSLVPARRLVWVDKVADIVHIPMMPLEHAGRFFGHWLRPPPGEFDEFTPEAQKRLELLTDEAARTELLRLQALRRTEELEEELRQLQQARLQTGPIQADLITAPITGDGSNATSQIFQLKVSQQQHVTPGTIAVHAGVHLMGRVGRVTPTGCELVALTHASMGPIAARVMPASRPDAAPADGQLVLLEPVGDGTLAGECRADAGLAVGDTVRLDDSHWPPTAQMMLVGSVESLSEKPNQPLRVRLIVRPKYRLGDLSSVILKIERQGSGR